MSGYRRGQRGVRVPGQYRAQRGMERGPGGGGHQVQSRDIVPLKRGKISIFMVDTFLLNCTIHFRSPGGVLQWHRFLLLHIVSATSSILYERVENLYYLQCTSRYFVLWFTYLRHFELFFLLSGRVNRAYSSVMDPDPDPDQHGSASNWKGGSGSGYASKWQAGSGFASGTTSKWKVGSGSGSTIKVASRIRIRILFKVMRIQSALPVWTRGLDLTITPPHPSCYGLLWVATWVHQPLV